MRPLTDEEMAFQNQHYAEINKQDFKRDKEIYGAYSINLHSP